MFLFCFLDFFYDVYIIYSFNDWDWFGLSLLLIIERDYGFKCFNYCRDFMIGNYIIDCIMDVVVNSKSIIVVIFYNFIVSNWCKFELNLVMCE